MNKTALATLSRIEGLPAIVGEATRLNLHPQTRTAVFHQVFGAPIARGRPNLTFDHMDDQRVAFRAAFVLSEVIELLEKGLGIAVTVEMQGLTGARAIAVGSGNAGLTKAVLATMSDRDLIEVLDALGDLNVVVNGFGVELGVDMRAVDAEIFASNMTKLGSDGQPIVSDGTDGHPRGKIIKGPHFMEPQIAAALGLDMGEVR